MILEGHYTNQAGVAEAQYGKWLILPLVEHSCATEGIYFHNSDFPVCQHLPALQFRL